MVALGWILGKSASQRTITIGDGNSLTKVFDETYKLADDCKIFLVDNNYSDGKIQLTRGLNKAYPKQGSWSLVKQGSFADIKVTAKANGEIYFTPERYTALCVFDADYRSSWKDGAAKVKELYLYNNPIVLHQKDLNLPDGVQYDGTSWYPVASKKENINSFTYNGSAIPFILMKDRLYSVGDTYTHIFLFKGDDGTLTLLDQGNRGAAYQYWLNLAALGFDPRDVDNILLTHGHGDHYQALYENQLMIERAGQAANVIVNSYAQGATVSSGKTTYKVGQTLPDMPVLSVIDMNPKWDAWETFLGPGFDVYIWRSLGHSDDTASFVFKAKATGTDEYFQEGDIVSWVYYGGYGAVADVRRGSNRLAISAGLQYQAAVVSPWAAAQSDYVYCLPQHTNQYPLLEVAKAARVARIPIMEALTEGVENIANFCEKRVAVHFYEWMDTAYRNKQDSLGNLLMEQAGFRCSSSGSANFDTVQAHGPFKRPAGEYTIKVQAVNVMHGFDAFLNKSEKFVGQQNVYGFDLSKGMVIDKDSYTHDPDGWYVQVLCNVEDSYDGGVVYDTNFYKGQYTFGADNKILETPWLSGPIEFTIDPKGWFEILRTERFPTMDQALAYASALTNGSDILPYETHSVNGGRLYNYSDTTNHGIKDYGNGKPGATSYKVQLSISSEILLGRDVFDTFKKVE